MKKVDSELQERISLLVDSMGYELLGGEESSLGGKRMFRLFIDSPTGVTADDCSKVSHQVSALMDVEDPIKSRYVLEVSSPGIDRPLFTLGHYERFIGSEIKIRLHAPLSGRRQYQGLLKRVESETVYLAVSGSAQEVAIPFSAIDRGNLIGKIEF